MTELSTIDSRRPRRAARLSILLTLAIATGCAAPASGGPAATEPPTTGTSAGTPSTTTVPASPTTVPASPVPLPPSPVPLPPSPAPAPPSPAPAEPTVSLDPPPAAGPFAMDLYRPNAHVPQYHPSWCVGSSMQMMINLMEPGPPDRSRETQQELYDLARELSPWEETAPGASIYGWIAGLELLGHGDFEEMATDTHREALRMVARQMRLTGRPVGLWVWGGKHAWVVSGFEATADPAYTDDFRVTHVWVEDPWSVRVSSIWGPGLEPHTRLTARELRADFLRYANRYRPHYGPEGKFTIIAPVA